MPAPIRPGGSIWKYQFLWQIEPHHACGTSQKWRRRLCRRSCEGWPEVASTGRDTGAEFGKCSMETVEEPNVESKWEKFVQAR